MVLQLWPITYSANKANDYKSQSYGWEKIKFEEEPFRETLVADTALELGAEASDFED
jgi:hypothetical protein